MNELRWTADEARQTWAVPPWSEGYFDVVGADLFERICDLPEYYLTRAELEILRARSGEIAKLAGPNVALLEYGSGAGVKIRLLLGALESPAAYVPIALSPEQPHRVAPQLPAA